MIFFRATPFSCAPGAILFHNYHIKLVKMDSDRRAAFPHFMLFCVSVEGNLDGVHERFRYCLHGHGIILAGLGHRMNEHIVSEGPLRNFNRQHFGNGEAAKSSDTNRSRKSETWFTHIWHLVQILPLIVLCKLVLPIC